MDLIENDPLKGSQTDIDSKKSNEDEKDSSETIEPDQDNHARREFEIGQFGSEQLQEDERTRDASGNEALDNTKPCQRKF
ncbi:hypothetical protein [Flavobacterium frigidimaris]|nr:hypothetical protein [Flavobacterium frigidimaris]